VLSRSGITINDQTLEFDDHTDQVDHAPRGQWIASQSHDGDRLLAFQRVGEGVRLGLDLRFETAVELAHRNRLCELVEVILDLAANVFIRSKLHDLRIELDHRSDRDALISKLNDGIALTDSFTSIATAIASETLVDRISLLRCHSAGYRLVTSSTNPKSIVARDKRNRWKC